MDFKMNINDQIQEWFSQRFGGGLVLPNGWFGRPYDSVHQLSALQVSSDSLLLTLDNGQLVLKFDGIPVIDATHAELVFSGFRSLRFDWKEYGSNKAHTDCFESGVVKIITPPGA